MEPHKCLEDSRYAVYNKWNRLPYTSRNALDVSLGVQKHDREMAIEESNPELLANVLVFRRIGVNARTARNVSETFLVLIFLNTTYELSLKVEYRTYFLRSTAFLAIR